MTVLMADAAHINQTEIFGRIALKAQNQTRRNPGYIRKPQRKAAFGYEQLKTRDTLSQDDRVAEAVGRD